jgi:hypothetical protein
MQKSEVKTTDNNMIAGVRLFAKHPNAPEFVIADMVLTLDDLYAWAKTNPETLTEYQGKKQIKLQILRSKDGAPYAKLNTYNGSKPAEPKKETTEDLPF